MHIVVHHSENLSINTTNKNFASSLLSQGSIKQCFLLVNIKNVSFWGVISFRYWISVLNQLKPTIYELLFLSALCFPKRDNRHACHFTITKAFPGLGPILTTDLKYWLTVKFLQIFFLLTNVPMKIKVSQVQKNWFVFKETPACKGRISATPYP